MQADLSGKVAVLIGATRGIGRAIALKLAAAGAQVVVNGRSEQAGEALCEEAAKLGLRPALHLGDMLDYANVQQLVASTVSQFGRLDILVNSGGNLRPGARLFEDTRPEDISDYFEGRLLRRLYPIHAVIPQMKRQRYGKIVSLTTDAGRVPTPGESMIGAAAAALIFATRALARELARWGIRINAISTTLTADTPSHDSYLAARARNSEAVIVKAFAKLEGRAAFRLNRPGDLAELALYLCAGESDQLSGATISVNGGVSFPSY